MKKRDFRKGISAILGFMLLVSVLFICIDCWCFAKPFYKKEYMKLNTAEEIGITKEELDGATDALLDYLQKKRDDIVCYAEIDGNIREVFDERETLHMVDVRKLYQSAKTIAYVFLVISVIGYAMLIYKSKSDMKPLLDGYMTSNIMLLTVGGAIGLFAAVDFDVFWTNFHLLFFKNDLWLLDPETEIMIQMVPEQFFMDLVIGIAVCFVAFMAVLLALCIYFRKKSVIDR